MAEYIERESAIEAIMSDPPDAHYPSWYIDRIKTLSAADVVEVRHGRWIEKTAHVRHSYFECSNCGAHENKHTAIKGRFCWSCGAIMDGDTQWLST